MPNDTWQNVAQPTLNYAYAWKGIIMKKFRLQPHEIGYLKLLYSTFSGIDYATSNATLKMESENDEQIMKTIREVQIQSSNGLASEYIRAALIMKKVLNADEKVFCVFDPTDENKNGECIVMTMDEYAERLNAQKTDK